MRVGEYLCVGVDGSLCAHTLFKGCLKDFTPSTSRGV